MKFFVYLVFLSVLLGGLPTFAQERIIENAGFIPDTIWLSKEPTTVGETITIYTAVWNSSPDDISGTVIFYDNDTKITTLSFSLSGNGSTKVLSTPWKVSAGNHKLYASVSESKGVSGGKPAVTVSLAYDETKTAEKFVSAPVKSESATSTLADLVVDTTESLQVKMEEVLPEGVKGVSRVVAQTTEPLREAVQAISEKEVRKVKDSLETPKSQNENFFDAVKGPLAYAKLFFFALLSFIANNTLIFYSLIFIAFFYFLRFLKNLFF